MLIKLVYPRRDGGERYEYRELSGQPEMFKTLMSMARYNAAYYRSHPDLPLLYDTDVYYEKEPIGEEDWQTAPINRLRGKGDCEDLGADRLGELWARGIDPRAKIFLAFRVRRGHKIWHVQIERGDGSIEDPSRILLPRGSQVWR